MSQAPVWTKKTTFATKGKNQMEELIAKPHPGDTARVHVVGYKIEYNKPRFQIGKTAFFNRKVSKTRFLDTHVIGDTAFITLPISPSKESARSVNEGDARRVLTTVLMQVVQTMNLGDSAEVHFITGPDGMLEHVHKGQYEASIPSDVHLVLHVDLFRIVRDGREHFRPTRNGLGGWAVGSPDLVGIYNDLTGNPNRRK